MSNHYEPVRAFLAANFSVPGRSEPLQSGSLAAILAAEFGGGFMPAHIDVWKVSTYDAALFAKLKSHADLIRNYLALQLHFPFEMSPACFSLVGTSPE